MKNEKCDAEKKIIIPKLENMIDIYDKLKSNEEKNALLKTILEKLFTISSNLFRLLHKLFI